jgi:hypothetical protein
MTGYINLFIDDERFPPNDGREWVIARNYEEAIKILSETVPVYISFDHDLGEEKTGYDVAKWITFKDVDEKFQYLPDDFDFYVHSQNPIGRENITCTFETYLKFREFEKCS